MAIPALAALYRTVASYGYKVARKLDPEKVKKTLKPIVDRATKPGLQRTKFASAEGKLIKGIRGASKKGFGAYKTAYKATLSTPGRRKTTSGTLGGIGLGSFLSGDDKDI
jgi:hypothetical protein|tara:strand:- start:142 stop:471 length:330 start_codon:yes stop_codon:yes gene_type:complete